MTTGHKVENIESTYQKTQTWLKELQDLGQMEDEGQAYSVLRAVLHALRDRLTVDEGANLASQLPLLVTGVYYDGWKPANAPSRERTRESFVQHVREQFGNNENIDAEQAISSVFGLLSEKVTAGEIADVQHMLPEPVRELWP